MENDLEKFIPDFWKIIENLSHDNTNTLYYILGNNHNVSPKEVKEVIKLSLDQNRIHNRGFSENTVSDIHIYGKKFHVLRYDEWIEYRDKGIDNFSVIYDPSVVHDIKQNYK